MLSARLAQQSEKFEKKNLVLKEAMAKPSNAQTAWMASVQKAQQANQRHLIEFL
jgi:hypothetical protein